MKNLPKYIDLVFCVLVLPVMVIMFPIERWYHHFQNYFIALGVWLYLLYFINRLVTVPFLFRKGWRRMASISIMAVSLAVTYRFSAVILYTPPPNIHDIGIVRLFPEVRQYQQAVWSLFMIVEAFSFAVGLMIQTELQRSRRREAELERDRAELQLYKAQIKPHFMFNTLNSLYGLFLTGSDKALPSLERFIEMMRYIHTTACREFVSLHEETDYIRQLVEIQSLRLNDRTKVALHTEIADKELLVPPMLLVTFVENCFKHGVSPVEKSTILISITEKERHLRLHTSNHVFPVKKDGEHLGIQNCIKRLELNYPKKHKLSISDREGIFEVELTIDL